MKHRKSRNEKLFPAFKFFISVKPFPKAFRIGAKNVILERHVAVVIVKIIIH